MCFTFLQCFNNRELNTFINLKLRKVTRNTTKEKSPEAIKQELLTSVMEEEDYSGLKEEAKIGRASQ